MGNMFADAKRLTAEQKAAGTYVDRNASKRQAATDWQNSFYGRGAGSTPLSEFQRNRNTEYAMDNIGWDKAQGLRQKAEAADVGAAPPPGHWDRKYNYANDEMEWIKKDPGNFWKANKEELIQMGGFIAGGLVGAPMLGMALAKTGREVKKSRDARRDIQHDKRQWEYERGQDAAAEEEARRANMGNLFRSGGEGVIEYATKDLKAKKRDQYVRQA